MITWMQRHKKYLITTIWVSTIAFVGAGFVGWGDYEYGHSRDAVAKVGTKEILANDVGRVYNNIFEYYSRMSGGKLDKEQAKKMGLEQMALQTLINEALFENYANDLGVEVTDKEIQDHILKMEPFQEKGQFNREKYTNALNQTGMSIKVFEENIRQSLLISKIQNLFGVKVTPFEENLFAGTFFGTDKLSYKILSPESVKAEINDNDIKTFWEKNKAQFKTDELYDLQIVEIPVITKNFPDSTIANYYETNKNSLKDNEGKILSLEQAKPLIIATLSKEESKQEALKKYISFKKGEISGTSLNNVALMRSPLHPTLVNALLQTKKPETLKPIEMEKGFVIAKIIKVTPSTVMTYEQAKPLALANVKRDKTVALLQQKANEEFKNFQGTELGFIGRDDAEKLNFVTKEEANKILTEVFSAKSDNVTVFLPTKVVLVKILEQKLFDKEKSDKNHDLIISTGTQVKERALFESLLKYLKEKYTVTLYSKPEEKTK